MKNARRYSCWLNSAETTRRTRVFLWKLVPDTRAQGVKAAVFTTAPEWHFFVPTDYIAWRCSTGDRHHSCTTSSVDSTLTTRLFFPMWFFLLALISMLRPTDGAARIFRPPTQLLWPRRPLACIDLGTSSTRSYQALSTSSAVQAKSCLTSVFGWELVDITCICHQPEMEKAQHWQMFSK